MQKVSFNVDGQKLMGTLFYPEQVKAKNPSILFLHGWGHDETRLFSSPEALTEKGFICMTYDMRSHGKSEGDREKLTRQDFLNDAIAAYDFLIQRANVDLDHIYIVGWSFGSYMATILSTKRKIRGLVLGVPANYADEGFENSQNFYIAGKTENWRKNKLDPEDTASLRGIHTFTEKVLIVEAELDEYIPHQTVINYQNATKNKFQLSYHLLKGVGHNIRNKNTTNEYTNVLLDWFSDKV